MARAILMACLPWLVLLLMLILAAWVLVRSSRAQLRLGRLLELHRDEAGSVQSLSFVLTLPLFIMIMMMIVQVSQLMIGIGGGTLRRLCRGPQRGRVDSGRHGRSRGALLHQFLRRRSRRPGPGRTGARPHGRRLRPQQRRADLQDRARQPEVQQDRLGRHSRLRADFAVAGPGLAGPDGWADGCGPEKRLRHAVAELQFQRRHWSAAGSQAGLCHQQHGRPDPLFPQESGAAAGDV